MCNRSECKHTTDTLDENVCSEMANKYCSSSSENGSVRVFIYESELKFLKWLVLKKLKIETGGDLFGLWQDENTAVVQIILGPGKDCRRTTTSFHQDVVYLRKIGGQYKQRLMNIKTFCSL